MFITLEEFGVELLQFDKLSVLVLKALFEFHKFIDVDLFALKKFFICAAKVVGVTLTGIGGSGWGDQTVGSGLVSFYVLDWIVTIVFGAAWHVGLGSRRFAVH